MTSGYYSAVFIFAFIIERLFLENRLSWDLRASCLSFCFMALTVCSTVSVSIFFLAFLPFRPDSPAFLSLASFYMFSVFRTSSFSWSIEK